MGHEILDSELVELMVCPKCQARIKYDKDCLLYTSDAADE